MIKESTFFSAVVHFAFDVKNLISTISTYFFPFLISEFEIDDYKKYLTHFMRKYNYYRKFSFLNYNWNLDGVDLKLISR